jgi:phosphoglucomutase
MDAHLRTRSSLVKLKTIRYALATTRTTIRHGFVTRSAGVRTPNHFLTTAIGICFRTGQGCGRGGGCGQVHGLQLDDRPGGAPIWGANCARCRSAHVVCGWSADGSSVYGGEESAGASFLRQNGTGWTTDKDGFMLDLLAERSWRSPARPRGALPGAGGALWAGRFAVLDSTISPAGKKRLPTSFLEQVAASELAGEPTRQDDPRTLQQLAHRRAEGSHCAVGLPPRPSGTEDVYKVYAESSLSARFTWGTDSGRSSGLVDTALKSPALHIFQRLRHRVLWERRGCFYLRLRKSARDCNFCGLEVRRVGRPPSSQRT